MWLTINLTVKRLFDICSSTFAIVLLLPLWIVLGIWIKLDSKGSIIFKQDRRTKDGRIFSMWKYRSMIENAENIGSGLFSYDDDPRITKAGAFLRKTSIDELPQLFNVLVGDISIVGPRPCVTYELGDFETLNKKFRKRFQMKGGITGLAQCKGRNENSWEEKVTLDNEYIDRFKTEGFWLDVKIMWWTIAKVFKSSNINETKREGMTAEESAALDDEEVKRIAHLPDVE